VFSSQDLILIRHAAAATGGRLCGRTDVGLADGSDAAFAALSAVLPSNAQVRVSPARRCRETLSNVLPAVEAVQDGRLWEQDFGDWEGVLASEIPDAGDMDRAALAEFSAPGGESFAALFARVRPALIEAAEQAAVAGPVVIVAHAGTVRAALSLALGEVSAGLAFEVDPLSVTRLRCLPGGGFSIGSVNWSPS